MIIFQKDPCTAGTNVCFRVELLTVGTTVTGLRKAGSCLAEPILSPFSLGDFFRGIVTCSCPDKAVKAVSALTGLVQLRQLCFSFPTMKKKVEWCFLVLASLALAVAGLGECRSDSTMASMRTLKDSSSGQNFGLMVICIVLLQVLLQSVSVAVTYVYFSNEMKQLQDKYSKSGLVCFLKEDESWDPTDREVLNDPCWQAKKQLHQFVREATLKTFKEMTPTAQEQIRSSPSLHGSGRPQRVAAHITGTSRRSSTALTPVSSDGNALGQKIQSWESSRKGHSFVHRLLLRNGELVIPETGLYYIYSQTYFRFQEGEIASKAVSKDRRKNKQMVQYIYKLTSYPDPILLMKSARNSCWSKDSEYGLYSIYQGGLFELKEDDRIFVSVTNQHLIDLDQEASFFGAFLIT